MKIKLAILCPIRRKIAPGAEGTLENNIYALAEALAAMGVDVTLFAVAGSQSPGGLVGIVPKPMEGNPELDPATAETMALAEAFSRIKEYDLVHSFFGPAALPYAKLLGVPMVATEPSLLSPEHQAMHEDAPDKSKSYVFSYPTDSASRQRAAMIEKFRNNALCFVEDSLSRYSAEDAADFYLEIYKEEILARRENYRPWGHYENLAEGPDHKIKRITVAPGARLSYQKHQRRAERWVVISGEAVVTLEGEDIRLSAGDTIFIPKGAAHRMNNPGSSPLVFGEVQLGDYFGEDDIIRLQDDYGRSG